MMKRLPKPSRLLALGSALSLLLGLAALATGEERAKLTVVADALEGDHMTVTVALQDVRFNVAQFYLEYDADCLEPRNIYQGGAASNALFMTEYAEKQYNDATNPNGWLASSSSASLDSTAHTLRYVLQVEPASAGHASDSEGYYTVGEAAPVLKLHFTVTDASKLYTDSLRLGGSSGVPNGIIIADGSAQGLTDPALVRIDLTGAGAVENPAASPDPSTSAAPSPSPDTSASVAPSPSGSESPSPAPTVSPVPSPSSTPSGGGSGGGGGGGDKNTSPDPTHTPAPTADVPAEVPSTRPEVALRDIDGNWAEESIRALVEAGYISGKPGGVFAPDDGVSRAEFATLLTRVMKVPGETGDHFADTLGHWAQEAINAAYSHGFVTGIGDGFAPDRLITRQELVVILNRALQLTGGQSQPFTDDESLAPWAKDAVYAVRGAGYITGYPDGSFGPERTITRAEMAQIMAKLLK